MLGLWNIYNHKKSTPLFAHFKCLTTEGIKDNSSSVSYSPMVGSLIHNKG